MKLVKLAGATAIAATAIGATVAFSAAPAAHADHECTLGAITLVHPDWIPCVPGATDVPVRDFILADLDTQPVEAIPNINKGGQVGVNAPPLSVNVFNCWGQDIPFGYMCPSDRPNPSDWVACNTWPPTSVVRSLAECPRL
ncbi:hypothetical protein KIH27_16285 [Mycobacterium sp. M1]|uniref:Secreted protein n=1 Tax=Mycolicibacter acidiphilus TaxID=2835306 RepID=A0ABS5RNS9_9MYCO|nr:hypothetical protein [Mycolicibacter acidiphilus]MBS9535146.1 hypothetical protein [Mycolicibacter acidiphilus]